MFVLGIQGSPRKKGNTRLLLASFLEEAERLGCEVERLEVAEKNIHGCTGCGYCENEGYCIIEDDMTAVYPLLWQSDLIVLATPIFFYSAPAQAKALIDRSQALWSRKYVQQLKDPGRRWRLGYMLALGATKGENLFTGMSLTAKYFFDAVGANYKGKLTFRQIEKAGEIKDHASAFQQAKEHASLLIEPLRGRKKLLFACGENRCRSQMAAAFAQQLGGDRIEAKSAGNTPAEAVDDVMIKVMEEKGLDLAFRTPKAFDAVIESWTPDLVISMGCDVVCPVFPGAKTADWGLPDPAGKPIGFMRTVRDDIEAKVAELVRTI